MTHIYAENIKKNYRATMKNKSEEKTAETHVHRVYKLEPSRNLNWFFSLKQYKVWTEIRKQAKAVYLFIEWKMEAGTWKTKRVINI